MATVVESWETRTNHPLAFTPLLHSQPERQRDRRRHNHTWPHLELNNTEAPPTATEQDVKSVFLLSSNADKEVTISRCQESTLDKCWQFDTTQRLSTLSTLCQHQKYLMWAHQGLKYVEK